ncbi:hypothetical protein AML86_01910 [Escherichia coli]|nr:hypothetical protein AML86_01910 [Escherichia coli]
MLPSETMIWKPEFTDKTLSRKPGAVHIAKNKFSSFVPDTGWIWIILNNCRQIFQQIYLTSMFLLNTIHRIHRNLLTKDSMDSRCREFTSPCIGDFQFQILTWH